MSARLFDTHCHLDHRKFADDLDGVITRAKEAGVERIATIGCARYLDSVEDALRLAQKMPDFLVTTIGVHPHDASHAESADGELYQRVAQIAEQREVVAVGEMGLDYYYTHSPKEVQQEVFRRQIGLAKTVKKPIVVHTRDAAADTLRILREESASDVGGIIHCFSEDAEFAKAALDMGFVSSFSGIVTFKKAQGVQEAAMALPLDSILVETDAPYLAPMPMRGKRNEPSFVAHTAAKVAELRGIEVEQLHEATWKNAHRVFRLAE